MKRRAAEGAGVWGGGPGGCERSVGPVGEGTSPVRLHPTRVGEIALAVGAWASPAPASHGKAPKRRRRSPEYGRRRGGCGRERRAQGSRRNACAVCMHPEGGREGGGEGGREERGREGGRETLHHADPSSSYRPVGPFCPLRPQAPPPSRWHVAAVHIDSDYPSQFEKADAGPKRRGRPRTFGSGEGRVDGRSGPLEWGHD